MKGHGLAGMKSVLSIGRGQHGFAQGEGRQPHWSTLYKVDSASAATTSCRVRASPAQLHGVDGPVHRTLHRRHKQVGGRQNGTAIGLCATTIYASHLVCQPTLDPTRYLLVAPAPGLLPHDGADLAPPIGLKAKPICCHRDAPLITVHILDTYNRCKRFVAGSYRIRGYVTYRWL